MTCSPTKEIARETTRLYEPIGGGFCDSMVTAHGATPTTGRRWRPASENETGTSARYAGKGMQSCTFTTSSTCQILGPTSRAIWSRFAEPVTRKNTTVFLISESKLTPKRAIP